MVKAMVVFILMSSPVLDMRSFGGNVNHTQLLITADT